jgi:hypothetical protein
VFLRRVFGNEKAEAVQDWDDGDESEFLATAKLVQKYAA